MNNALPLSVLALFLTGVTAGAMPEGIHYQAYLTDAVGAPLSAPVQITFRLYDAETAGAPVWTDTQLVAPANGLFSVTLGSAANPLPAELFAAPLWLGITVESDAEMTPRRPLLGAAWAYHAQTAQAVAPQALCSPGDFVQCYTGPADTLDIGLCRSGTRTCAADTGFGACANEITPVTEQCFDGQDNNCDGQVDEDCDCPLYRDVDGDGFGDAAAAINDCDGEPGFVANDLDCFDQNPNARPGQSAFFPSDRGDGSFDYDCDGSETPQDTTVGSCPSSPPCTPTPGWFSFIPSCGQSAPRLGGCDQVLFECEAQPGSVQLQACR